jgi:hypothetical protein
MGFCDLSHFAVGPFLYTDFVKIQNEPDSYGLNQLLQISDLTSRDGFWSFHLIIFLWICSSALKNS